MADRERFLVLFAEHLGCGWVILLGVLAWRGEWSYVWVLLALQIGARLLLRPRSHPIDDFLTLPPPSMPFPCNVAIKSGAAPLGFDRGIVTFVDGWLVFDGRRTSFSLCRNDVRKRDRDDLYLEDVTVCFVPEDEVASGDFHAKGLKSQFSTTLDNWYRIERSVSGKSVLPPRTLHIGGVVRIYEDLLYCTLFLGATIGLSIWLSVNFFVAAIILGSIGGLKNAVDAALGMRKVRVRERAFPATDAKALESPGSSN